MDPPVDSGQWLYDQAVQYEEGKGVTRSIEKARSLYIEAADKGHLQALHKLGKILQRNKEYREARQCYEEAALKGEALSQYELATMCGPEGWGDDKGNIEKERQWLEKLTGNIRTTSLSDQSYKVLVSIVQSQASCRLGYIFLHGLGYVKKAPKLAEFYYYKALELHKENDDARYALAMLYLPTEQKKAIAYLCECQDSYAPSQCALGTIARNNGEYAKALAFYAKALGYAEAHFHAGTLYEEGKGTARNVKQGLKHYCQAASQGYVPALEKLKPYLNDQPEVQLVMGKVYRDGIIETKDIEKAVRFFMQAYRGNCKEALSELKKLVIAGGPGRQYALDALINLSNLGRDADALKAYNECLRILKEMV